jgi:uncharacterized protein YbgA (DUF1722 family)
MSSERDWGWCANGNNEFGCMLVNASLPKIRDECACSMLGKYASAKGNRIEDRLDVMLCKGITSGNPTLVKVALDNYGWRGPCKKDVEEALTEVYYSGNLEILDTLLNYHSNSKLSLVDLSCFKECPLGEIVDMGHFGLVKFLLEKYYKEYESSEIWNGATTAVQMNRLDLLKLFLDAGFNIERDDPKRQILAEIIMGDLDEILTYLLENGLLKPNEKNIEMVKHFKPVMGYHHHKEMMDLFEKYRFKE